MMTSCAVQFNSTDSKRAFIIQKKIIRIMAGVNKKVSCRELFKKFNILPLASEFLLSLLFFLLWTTWKSSKQTDVHSTNTRHKHDLHQPSTNLTGYQKGAYYAGIKIFNSLPDRIKSLNHDMKVYASIERLSFISLRLLHRRIYFN
jgi:hypothetical protein